MKLESPAFENEGDIPDLYTCKGKEISPPLKWIDPPENTKTFALIMEDLDTPLGVITHWILYNIPGDTREIPEDIPHKDLLHDGIIQGRNGMRKNKYMGPCPPWGRHRYVITLYALDIELESNPKLNKKKLLRLISKNTLDQAKIMGYYSKK